MSDTPDRAHAVIDLEAIRHNVRLLAGHARGARFMAVVKANGYGHGATAAATAALDAGADWLGVHTVGEAEDVAPLAGGVPVLVMGPIADSEWVRAGAIGAHVAVWSPEGVTAADAAGVAGLHLKLDTGMGRLGARPETLGAVVEAARTARTPVSGLMTHFATADDREGEHAGFMNEQLMRFRSATRPLSDAFPGAILHAANSAATLREPRTHLDMVRCGIAVYGCSPFHDDAATHDLRPAMSLISHISSIKTVRSRDSVGYGRTWRAARGTRIGLVPVGYADGYARSLGNQASVIVNGRLVPVVGTISMDQLTIDLGPESTDVVGDRVTLMGSSGGERVTAEQLGDLRGTINYEVTCGIGPRIPRRTIE
ncbi:MAG: alanine racemase [Thermoleophilia bacterium]|nr:alanine racemase [Thermoleophilia bacterium]